MNRIILFFLVFLSNTFGQQAFALPPTKFTDINISFTQFSGDITGSVEGGLLLGSSSENISSIFVNGNSYNIPPGTNVILHIKQALLRVSPYCSPLIIKKKQTDDIALMIAPLLKTPSLHISSYDSSINGTFYANGNIWKFVLASVNNTYANRYPGYIPLQCSN